MIQYLALGPGGMGFFAMLGTLQMLQDTNKLDLKEISGASAGAILAFLYILTNGKINEILNMTMKTDLKSITNISLRSFITNYGLININGAKKKLSLFCKKSMNNKNPTFLEFYEKYKIKLHIATYCISEGKTVYFSVDNYPNTKVIDAVCASIAVPYLFASSTIHDKVYIDGGIAEDVPAQPFLIYNPNDVHSIKINTKDKPLADVNDLKSFSERLVFGLLRHRINYSTKIININLEDFDIFDFKIDDKKKLELFVTGYLSH